MEVELIKTPQQPTAVVHETVRLDALTEFFSRAFGQVAEAMQHQGLKAAGPPFALYFGEPRDTVEVEAGFPVSRAVAPEGPVHQGQLPGGPVVHATHQGPYEALGKTYDELMQWMGSHGLKPHREMWEVYMTDPQHQPDPNDWRTEVYWPVD